MIGPGPVNCQIRRKDDGTARCETHGVDFGTAGPEVVQAHVREANLQWHAERDFLERAAQGQGWGTAIGSLGAFLEVAMNEWKEAQRLQRERDAVQERIAKALELIADRLEDPEARIRQKEREAFEHGK